MTNLQQLLTRIKLGESEARFILFYGQWLTDRGADVVDVDQSQGLAIALYALLLKSGLSQIQAAEAVKLSKNFIDGYAQGDGIKADALLIVDGHYLAVQGFDKVYDLAQMKFCSPAEIGGRIPVNTTSYHLAGIAQRILGLP